MTWRALLRIVDTLRPTATQRTVLTTVMRRALPRIVDTPRPTATQRTAYFLHCVKLTVLEKTEY